jgi:hypothetical protein
VAQQAGWRNKLRQKLPDWLADLLGNTLGAVIAGLILFAVGISVVVVVVNKVEDNGGDAPTTPAQLVDVGGPGEVQREAVVARRDRKP